jgi:hypothetical protein
MGPGPGHLAPGRCVLLKSLRSSRATVGRAGLAHLRGSKLDRADLGHGLTDRGGELSRAMFPRSRSGSLAMLAAMRRASSRVEQLGRSAAARLILEIDRKRV